MHYGVSVPTERITACPLCGCNRLVRWCEGRDRLHRVSADYFTYSRCRGCGLIFLSVRPPELEAHRFYPADYGPYQSQQFPRARTVSWLGRACQPAFYRALSTFDKLSRDLLGPSTRVHAELEPPRLPGEQLLDYGCGSDAFLNRARALGWKTIGMDFSHSVVERVIASGHAGHVVSSEAWDAIADGSLQFVRLNHVLEHLYRPRELLATLRAKMRAGGTLHVATPNAHGFSAQLFRSCWWGLECPRHVMFYSSKLLGRLLEEEGFRCVSTVHEVITKDAARSIGYALHELGGLEHRHVETMADRPILASALQMPACLAARIGKSDRFHVFACASAG